MNGKESGLTNANNHKHFISIARWELVMLWLLGVSGAGSAVYALYMMSVPHVSLGAVAVVLSVAGSTPALALSLYVLRMMEAQNEYLRVVNNALDDMASDVWAVKRQALRAEQRSLNNGDEIALLRGDNEQENYDE